MYQWAKLNLHEQQIHIVFMLTHRQPFYFHLVFLVISLLSLDITYNVWKEVREL
jgi:hypothetical protein